MALPTFLLIGAPKAGTTALHAALAQHPELYLSPVKEPKYFLCEDRPPDRSRQRGPGDAHSAREWVWDRRRYEALFDAAPPGVPRGESTPFYLYDRDAQRRIAAAIPDVRLIAMLRDPVDRAQSNWMHLWSDGLETEPDFLTAMALEDQRVAEGWAPFWHFRRLGLYGEQLAHLYDLFPREQVLLLRYRELVEDAAGTVRRVTDFLDVEHHPASHPPEANVKGFRAPTRRNAALAKAARVGAAAGAMAPPEVWRTASKPIVRAMQSGRASRPHLGVEERRALVSLFADDVRLLEQLTGASFGDWLADEGRGSFAARRGRAGAVADGSRGAPPPPREADDPPRGDA